MHDNTGLLSDGLKVRVALGCALASKPRLVLIDEALDYLDPEYVSKELSMFFEYARLRGMSVICVTHHVPLAADQLVVLREGRLSS